MRTLVETGALVGAPGAYRLAQTLPTVQVPATVQAVLAARIDRLSPEEKRLLQTAAVIGHEVPLPLVQAIAELPEADLHRGLAHLQTAEFLYETRLFPEREFTFKHALTHEVAYGSLLSGGACCMRALLRRSRPSIPTGWLSRSTDSPTTPCVARCGTRPCVTCVRPVSRRQSAPANSEAVAYFEQALEALTHLPESRSTRAVHRPPARCTASTESARETEQILEHLREAERLAEALDDQLRLGRVAAPHHLLLRGR